MLNLNDTFISINFMWVSDHLIESGFIDGSNNTEDFEKNILTTILSWGHAVNADQEKKYNINLWYDSQMATPNVVEATNNLILLRARNENFDQFISLRDIRKIDLVKKNQAAFKKDVPVYLKVDLLRVIVAFQSYLENSHQIFVYSDLNISPIARNQLFNNDTLEALNDIGLVLCMNTHPADKAMAYGHMPYENSFFILNLADEHVVKAHVEVLINMPLQFIRSNMRDGISSEHEQYVYGSYSAMLEYLFFLKGKVAFHVNDQEGQIFSLSYKPKKIVKKITDFPDLRSVKANDFFHIGSYRVSKSADPYIDKEYFIVKNKLPKHMLKNVDKPPSKQYGKKH